MSTSPRPEPASSEEGPLINLSVPKSGVDGEDVVLHVHNLSVTLEGRSILHDINFHIARGSTMGIVGPNGAGKTMLIRTLMGFVPHGGTVKWTHPVRIGYVPQNFAVGDIPITVDEFLRFKHLTDYRKCIESVGLDFDAVIHERLGSLSGGEMQRVLIAWAIVDQPDVLFFDEPTSNIHYGGEEIILQTLNQIEKSHGLTVLLVSHDIHNVMTYTDTALALNRTITYFGPSRNLSDPQLLDRIYGIESLLEEHRH